MSRTVPIVEGLFTWPAEAPRLIGGRCRPCGVVTFPAQSGCPRCNSDDIERVELPDRGTLWTYTTQHFRPKSPPDGPYLGPDSPDSFVPYAVGYVELPDHCKVESRLIGPVDGFEIGMDMRLVIVPFRTDDDGNDVVTFAFEAAS